jgi:hypothetical protein
MDTLLNFLARQVEQRVAPVADEIDRARDVEAGAAPRQSERAAAIRARLVEAYKNGSASVSYQDLYDTYEAAHGLLSAVAAAACESVADVEVKKWVDGVIARAIAA